MTWLKCSLQVAEVDKMGDIDVELDEVLMLLQENSWIYDFKLTRFFADRVWEHLPAEVSDFRERFLIDWVREHKQVKALNDIWLTVYD